MLSIERVGSFTTLDAARRACRDLARAVEGSATDAGVTR
jgi:hypothetical protein